MNKLKVLIVIADFSIGGGQEVVYELAKNIDINKIELKVLCYGGRTNTNLNSRAEKNFDVEYLNERGKATLSKIVNIFKAINKYSPDIVHAHLGGVFYSAIWATIYHKPLVITAHTKPAVAFSKKIEPLIKWLLYKNRVCIVAVSEENYRLLQEYYKITDSRLRFVNNGIDISKYYRNEHSVFTYINVARQDKNKNQKVIIKCFDKIHKEYPTTKLILLGDGPEHDKLLNLIRELKLEKYIEIPGIISDVEKYYAVSDVYVQSSHREALPMSMLEAMASGLPLIATNVGGLKDIVKENGILVPDDDEMALYEAMKRMYIERKQCWNLMSRKSIEMVQKYSAKAMAQNYTEIYLSMGCK